MAALKDKIPPHDDTAEQATLGAALLDAEAIAVAIQYLRPDDFYSNANKAIYEAVLGLFNKGVKADILTITSELKQNGKLEEAGGAAYVASLTNVVPTSANAEYYAQTVQNYSLRRAMQRVSNENIAQSFDESLEPRAILEEIQQKLFDLSDNRQAFKAKSVRELLPNVIAALERIQAAKKEFTGIPSGFDELDKLTSGFQPSEFIIIGARPSVGKTALALTMASYISIQKHIPTAFFSLEMSDMSLMLRLISSEAKINSNKLRTGYFPNSDFIKIQEAAGRLYDAPLYLVDMPNMKLLDLRAHARRLRAQQKVAIIFIDYLGLINVENFRVPRFEQIAEVSRSLKSLARELDIPIVALSQLTRAAEGEKPNLSSLRDSGSIEQDADVVMFLHREREYEKKKEGGVNDSGGASNEGEKKEGTTSLILAKQRNGPVGTVQLTFLSDYTKFTNLSKERP
ncbi:MAG: replicative DNA helicase [Treponema sp.]|jgi:replicative DNA helicase|nr:replicative DNA helicase [Treponema sp.]